ncbi:toll/interleukin-1 receptor domain-containing protein [Alteromonas mediterranea]|uniref:toll/interleukin-1 receptor domain-containing protein n=1 Tax=Alteromonas mediterranea TaxID=314275 RepID=UPI00113284DA|nr:toll/interleukin-1 receptor domain-containing protein [Alteromonas mediterranea]QDG35735.1 toll/interleukin-1 receptor domain-containing protein [Alteromonas mediterranea]
MGKTQRKTSKYLELYRKSFKKKVNTVISFAPPNTSKDKFFDLFSEVYPEDVSSMEQHFKFYQEKNRNRKKGKPLFFPNPTDLLYEMAKAKLKHIKVDDWNAFDAEEEKKAALEDAKRDREKKLLSYRNKNISTQSVTPNYVIKLIKKYWSEKTKIRRLLIVTECGKYKNPRTILFFRRVLNKEPDWFIRNYCFRILQNFDEVVYLSSKGKGKKGQYDLLVKKFGCDYKEDIGRTAQDIINEFYDDDYIQNFKDFDVFISHAVSNSNIVDKLVEQLNSCGLVAFVDWKSDRADLSRTKSNTYTQQALELRMQQSKSMILIRTKESDLSKWVSWEIEYFYSLRKKIAVLNLEEYAVAKPKYMESPMPIAKFIDNSLTIISEGKNKAFSCWLKNTDTA